MIPTEHEYTVATHAAAKAAYENEIRSQGLDPDAIIAWDDLPRLAKNGWCEGVLFLVDAAISAIPDRLYQVREVLSLAGLVDADLIIQDLQRIVK